MKHFNSSAILFLAAFVLFSCEVETLDTLEKEPYFDLKGFIEEKIQEVDGAQVSKTSEIQGEQKQVDVTYSLNDWEKEFNIFTDADINKPSPIQAYETTSSADSLVHQLLPNSNEKVKYIKVSYHEGEVSSVSIKVADDNLFYSTTTVAKIFLDKTTFLLDHYSIETDQKIWFMDANNMKIQGEIVP